MSVVAIIAWICRAIAVFAALGAVLPFVRSGAWAVRVWDFPRLQMLLVIGAGIALAAVMWWIPKFRVESLVITVVLLIAGGFHIQAIVPYTRLADPTVPTTVSPDFGLVVVNLDVRNQRRQEVLRTLASDRPDVLLLVELDDEWARALAPLRDRYTDHVEHVRGDGLGIALWSSIPVRESSIKHLVSDRRASIHASLETPTGDRVRLIGIHPTPPALAIRDGEGRYDSRIRDAELVRVAELIDDVVKNGRYDACIVAGDFNDVAWSHTTMMFQRLSGLEDPRVGRGLYSTYHAQRPLLRYPLDHVFVTPNIAVADVRRIEIPGSDHFAIGAGIEVRTSGARNVPAPEAEDFEDASDMLEEGQQDAREQGERSPR